MAEPSISITRGGVGGDPVIDGTHGYIVTCGPGCEVTNEVCQNGTVVITIKPKAAGADTKEPEQSAPKFKEPAGSLNTPADDAGADWCGCADYDSADDQSCINCGHSVQWHEVRLRDDVDECECRHPKPAVDVSAGPQKICPRCGSDNVGWDVSRKPAWQECKRCGKQFMLMADGSIRPEASDSASVEPSVFIEAFNLLYSVQWLSPHNLPETRSDRKWKEAVSAFCVEYEGLARWLQGERPTHQWANAHHIVKLANAASAPSASAVYCSLCAGPKATGRCRHVILTGEQVTMAKAEWHRLTDELSEHRTRAGIEASPTE